MGAEQSAPSDGDKVPRRSLVEQAGAPRDPGAPQGGHDAAKTPRFMVDKRSSRRENRSAFVAGIEGFEAQRRRRSGDVPTAMPQRLDGAMSVVARKRPLFEHEHDRGEFDVVRCEPDLAHVHHARMRPDLQNMYLEHHEYQIDRCFGEGATNAEVYTDAAAPLVAMATRGGTATVMMFGQTGSGKTYTMNSIHEQAAVHLFEQLDARQAEADARNEDFFVMVSCSFVELAGTKCSDMLNRGASVQLLDAGGGRTVMRGVVEAGVTDAASLMSVIRAALKHRQTAATGVHDASSRSHAVCRVFLRSMPPPAVPFGQFTLVDLAGSERREDSALHDAARRRESAEINSSLRALKECARAMSLGERAPYREHNLTKLLRDSFIGGKRTRTVVIATISPSSADTEHTLSTMQHSCLMDGQGRAKTRVETTELPAAGQAGGDWKAQRGAAAGGPEFEVAVLSGQRAAVSERGAAGSAAGGAPAQLQPAAPQQRLEELMPSQWSSAQVCDWWRQTAPRAVQKAGSDAAAIRSSFDRKNAPPIAPVPTIFRATSGGAKAAGGLELIKFTRQRFARECSSDSVGNAMYQLLKDQIASVKSNRVRDEARRKRTLSRDRGRMLAQRAGLRNAELLPGGARNAAGLEPPKALPPRAEADLERAVSRTPMTKMREEQQKGDDEYDEVLRLLSLNEASEGGLGGGAVVSYSSKAF